MSHSKNHWLSFILPVLGIGFWFAIAYPFADRNESYTWIAWLREYSFIDIVQKPIPSIRNFRPMAQALTWCLYHLSGENGIIIQLMNFIALCAAIWIMISLTEAPRRFYLRLLYLMTGLIYISAFYYIFNLHGIFYSPILLMVALLLKAQEGVLIRWRKWLPISAVLGFFHPLIFVFYVAYVCGWIIERQAPGRYKLVLPVFLAAGLIILLNMVLPFSLFSVINTENILGTMRNVENHIIVRSFTLLLCLLTLVNKPPPLKAIFSGIIIMYVTTALIYNLPFLFLLGFLVLASLVIEGKWSLAGVASAAILFPIAVGSGAPTKASIFIFLLPYLLLRPVSVPVSAITERIPKTIALVLLAGIAVCAALVRNELRVPILSSMIRPILVEKGKTYQLQKALMLAHQGKPLRRIRFLQEKPANIRDYGQPRERDNFPPTKQKELDVFQRHVFSEQGLSMSAVWYMSFGTPVENDTLTVIHTLEEENCRPAYLYEVRRPLDRGVVSNLPM